VRAFGAQVCHGPRMPVEPGWGLVVTHLVMAAEEF